MRKFQFLIALGILAFIGCEVRGQQAPSASARSAREVPRRQTMLFVGDIMLSRGVGDRMRSKHDWDYPFEKIAPTLRAADLTFANLECPVSDKGRSQHHLYSFRADPRSIEGLKFAGIDVVSLANNHAYDWGPEALMDTAKRLRAAGIVPVGAGANDREAYYPVIVNLHGVRLAFLAYVHVAPRNATAQAARAGVAWLEPKRVMGDIRLAHYLADVVIVSVHWGIEYMRHPLRRQVEWAHQMIDSGADLVVGSHPHVVQPLEEYHGHWIAYSLGNFVFDQRDPPTHHGLMLRVTLQGKRIASVEGVPITIEPTFQPIITPQKKRPPQSHSATAGEPGARPVSVGKTPSAGKLKTSGPVVLRNKRGVVLRHLHITSTNGDCVDVINSTNVTIEASDIGPCGTNGTKAPSNGIRITGGSGINIFDNYIHVENLASGCCDSHDGVLVIGASRVSIQGNVIAYGESNIEVQGRASSDVAVAGNFLLNPRGPFPRGQNFQSWGPAAASPNSSITVTNNYAFSCVLASNGLPGVKCPSAPKYLFSEHQEDSINFGFTEGFLARGNVIVGGHSKSGCGLIDDEAANHGRFEDNVLRNTGQCGIGVSSGVHQTIEGNKILNLPTGVRGGNTALYVWNQYRVPCGPVAVLNNVADQVRRDGSHSAFWNGGGCGAVSMSNNTFNQPAVKILNSFLAAHPPPPIPPEPKECTAVSPYTTRTSPPLCY